LTLVGTDNGPASLNITNKCELTERDLLSGTLIQAGDLIENRSHLLWYQQFPPSTARATDSKKGASLTGSSHYLRVVALISRINPESKLYRSNLLHFLIPGSSDTAVNHDCLLACIQLIPSPQSVNANLCVIVVAWTSSSEDHLSCRAGGYDEDRK
jgi:hypothetical protein